MRKVLEPLKTTNYADNTDKKRPTKTEEKKSDVFVLCLLKKRMFRLAAETRSPPRLLFSQFPCRAAGTRGLASRVIRAIRGQFSTITDDSFEPRMGATHTD